MLDFEVQRCTRRCAATDRELKPGETFYSTLVVVGAKPNKPVQKEVWIINNYGEQFEIESISSKNGYIKVEQKEQIDKKYKLELQINPPAKENEQVKVFTDQLEVSIKDRSKLKIPCSGFYFRKRTSPPPR